MATSSRAPLSTTSQGQGRDVLSFARNLRTALQTIGAVGHEIPGEAHLAKSLLRVGLPVHGESFVEGELLQLYAEELRRDLCSQQRADQGDVCSAQDIVKAVCELAAVSAHLESPVDTGPDTQQNRRMSAHQLFTSLSFGERARIMQLAVSTHQSLVHQRVGQAPAEEDLCAAICQVSAATGRIWPS